MVIHQLQVRCRPGKVRRSETDVLPLSYTTNYCQLTGNDNVKQNRHRLIYGDIRGTSTDVKILLDFTAVVT